MRTCLAIPLAVLLLLIAPGAASAACTLPTVDADGAVVVSIGPGDGEFKPFELGRMLGLDRIVGTDGTISWCRTQLARPTRLVIRTSVDRNLYVPHFTHNSLMRLGLPVEFDASSPTTLRPSIVFTRSSGLGLPDVGMLPLPSIVADGFDLDRDGDTDISVRAARINAMLFDGPFEQPTTPISTRASTTPIDQLTVNLDGGVRDVTLDAPGATIEYLAPIEGGRVTVSAAARFSFVGGAGTDVVDARVVRGGGNHKSGGGADHFRFGPGADVVVDGAASGSVQRIYELGAGNDTARVFGGNLRVDGGAGNDSIVAHGARGTSVLSGGAGNDRLDIGALDGPPAGVVSVDAGAGADYVLVRGSAQRHGEGRVRITCGPGRDRLSAWGFRTGRTPPRACETWSRLLPGARSEIVSPHPM